MAEAVEHALRQVQTFLCSPFPKQRCCSAHSQPRFASMSLQDAKPDLKASSSREKLLDMANVMAAQLTLRPQVRDSTELYVQFLPFSPYRASSHVCAPAVATCSTVASGTLAVSWKMA